MPESYQHTHGTFLAEYFKEREERLRNIIEFWQVAKRITFSLLITASFLIFYLLSKLSEALSMLN